MRKKHPVPFTQKFPKADPLALRLLQRLLAFDPKDRPTAEEVCVLSDRVLSRNECFLTFHLVTLSTRFVVCGPFLRLIQLD